MPKLSFAQVYADLTKIAKRLVALENGRFKISVGPAQQIAVNDTVNLHTREIEIDGKSFHVVTKEIDP